jgi:hypothetical protein
MTGFSQALDLCVHIDGNAVRAGQLGQPQGQGHSRAFTNQHHFVVSISEQAGMAQ